MNPQDCLLRCPYCRFCNEFEAVIKREIGWERGEKKGGRRKEEGNCLSEGREVMRWEQVKSMEKEIRRKRNRVGEKKEGRRELRENGRGKGLGEGGEEREMK